MRLTALGRRRHASSATRTEILAEIMAPFTAVDREQLVEMVERFVESADKYVAARLRSSSPPTTPVRRRVSR